MSHTDNRNTYAILGDVHQSFYATIASTAHTFTGAVADDDLVPIGDTSRGTETRMRGMPWDDFQAALEVDAMDSGTATDGQVPAADGSGGIDWEDPSGGSGNLATMAPEDVADTAAVGTAARGAREDHVHDLPNDETLEFSSTGTLGVSITDVIEHLTQRIRYFTTDSLDHSTGGSAAGQTYDTNRYPKNIFKVRAEVRPDVASIYKAGIYTVTSGNQIIAVLGQSEDSVEYPANQSVTIDFDLTATGETDLGVPLEGGERIAILIRRAGAGNNADTRLRRGGEASNSPSVTYADAELDFALDQHVLYTHEDPEAGDDTDSHGDSIRGNIRIYYQVTIDHGSLLGDGNVHPDHIESTDADTGSWLIFPAGDVSAWRAIDDTDVEVAFPNVLTGLLGPLGATPNVGEALEILDDLHNRVCPAASGGTAGQVCARNTAGTAYELVDAGTGGGGGGGSGYGDWASIGSVTGAISGNPVTVALNTNETIDDYEELYIHIEANNANDQRVASPRFRVSDVPTTTLAGGGLGIPFAGNATDEGAMLVRRNADGDSLVLDAFGSVINFPATAVTSIYARALTTGGGGGSDDGVVDGVTLGYTDATRVVDLTVERTVGADLTASATIAFASTTVAGLIQTAVEAEVIAETAGVALTPSNLPDIDVDQLSSGTTPTGHLPYASSGGGVTWGAAPSGAGTELTQAMVEDETDTTFGTVSGERLSQAVAVFATGGGGGDTDRIILLDGETYSPGAARNFDFTEDIPARSILTFEIVGTSTGYAIMLSDDLLALTAQSGGPSTAANAYAMYARNHSNSLPTQNQGNSWLVWREDADSIYFRESRGSGGSLTITATPLGGGGTSTQQASSGITVVENQVITAIFPMTEAPLADDWRGTQQQGIPLTAIPKDEIDRIEFGIRIDSRYVIPFVVTRGMLNRLAPTSDIIPTSPANSAVMQGVYWSGRPGAPNASREHLILLPTYGYMDGRRLANRSGFFMTFDDDASGDNWVQAYVGANSGDEIDISYLTTYRFQTD